MERALRIALALLSVVVLSFGCTSTSSTDQGIASTSSAIGARNDVAACAGKLALPGPPMLPGLTNLVRAADVNGDGIPDLVGLTGAVSVRLGLGGGNFAPAVEYATAGYPSALTIGDFNGDRKLDIATVASSSASGNNASVLLNRGDGTFAAHVDYGTGIESHGIASGDLNRDGRTDLVIANLGSGTLSILTNQGQGVFAAGASYSVGRPKDVIVAEVTGDRWPDIIYTTNPSGSSEPPEYTVVLINEGFGRFDPSDSAVNLATSGYPRSPVAADLTGDGKLDLAVVHGRYATKSFVSVFVNKGRGAFESAVDYPLSYYGQEVVAADVTGDGKLDLVVDDTYLNVLVNQGNGTFAPKVEYQVGDFPSTVAAADFTGDGKVDVAVGHLGSDGVAVLVNQGGGTFLTPIAYHVGGSHRSVVSADFSGDGKPDLAGIDTLGNGQMNVLTNQGNGTFGPPGFYKLPYYVDTLVAADFTGDGKPDIAFANNGVGLVRNRGDGTFHGWENHLLDAGVVEMAAADVNGDGKMDLVLARAAKEGGPL